MSTSLYANHGELTHCEEGFNAQPPEKGEAGGVDEGGGDGCEREEGDGQVDLSDNDIL